MTARKGERAYPSQRAYLASLKGVDPNFNVPGDIQRLATKLGFEMLATGGGFDYVYKDLGKNDDRSLRALILIAHDDAGSPESLKEKATLMLILSQDWVDNVAIDFNTAKDALHSMGSFSLDRNQR